VARGMREGGGQVSALALARQAVLTGASVIRYAYATCLRVQVLRYYTLAAAADAGHASIAHAHAAADSD